MSKCKVKVKSYTRSCPKTKKKQKICYTDLIIDKSQTKYSLILFQ